MLREVVDQLNSEDSDLLDDVAFREKDIEMLREECLRKYARFTQMTAQRQELEEKVIRLKEELCKISPEALEEIERECSQRNEGEEDPEVKLKKTKPIKANSKAAKKNERRKKNQKITYS